MDDVEVNALQIFDFCYLMQFGAGVDVWRYHGTCPDHPISQNKQDKTVSPTRPTSFDEKNMILRTHSGRIYKIMSFIGDQQKIIEQIKSDIKNGKFEVY